MKALFGSKRQRHVPTESHPRLIRQAQLIVDQAYDAREKVRQAFSDYWEEIAPTLKLHTVQSPYPSVQAAELSGLEILCSLHTQRLAAAPFQRRLEEISKPLGSLFRLEEHLRPYYSDTQRLHEFLVGRPSKTDEKTLQQAGIDIDDLKHKLQIAD